MPVTDYYAAVVDDDGARSSAFFVLWELVSIECNVSVAARLGRLKDIELQVLDIS